MERRGFFKKLFGGAAAAAVGTIAGKATEPELSEEEKRAAADRYLEKQIEKNGAIAFTYNVGNHQGHFLFPSPGTKIEKKANGWVRFDSSTH